MIEFDETDRMHCLDILDFIKNNNPILDEQSNLIKHKYNKDGHQFFVILIDSMKKNINDISNNRKEIYHYCRLYLLHKLVYVIKFYSCVIGGELNIEKIKE